MRIKRFAIFIIVILAGIGLLCFVNGYDREAQAFDGNTIIRLYNRLKAGKINMKPIYVFLDDNDMSDIVDDIYMSDGMDLRIGIIFLNDLFGCDTEFTGDGRISLTGKGTSAVLDIIDKHDDGRGYVSLAESADIFGFKYSWDDEENCARLTSPAEDEEVLPESYDLNNYFRAPQVRDQGTDSTCWAFAAMAAAESAMLPEDSHLFSAQHLINENGFNIDLDEGGDYNIALAYMASWRGPVEDSDYTGPDDENNSYEPAVHLQEAVIVDDSDPVKIKKLILEYGAVQSAIYLHPDVRGDCPYYNSDTCAYYYPGSRKSNHDIIITGWDDSYSKENFKEEPSRDGAFICVNSWGRSFGKGGSFYISYDDENIGKFSAAYTKFESNDNYDQIYQSDLLGWTGSVGYSDSHAWFSDVYEADGDGSAVAAAFYATEDHTYYDIWFVNDFTIPEDLNDRVFVKSGCIEQMGYHTVDIGDLAVEDGEKFAVIVDIRSEGSIHPIAMEYPANEITENADITDGESYMSFDGNTWTSIEDEAGGNACLKVFFRSLK